MTESQPSGMLKFTRTLPVTFGRTTKTLPVVRVLATQVTHHPIALSVPDRPFSIVASETVEITFRAQLTDFYDEFMGAAMAEAPPHGNVQFGERGVKAMRGRTEPDERSGNNTAMLLTVLLLRVPVDATEFDDDWERDEGRSYARDGRYVTAMKPKPTIEPEGDAALYGVCLLMHPRAGRQSSTPGGVRWELYCPTCDREGTYDIVEVRIDNE